MVIGSWSVVCNDGLEACTVLIEAGVDLCSSMQAYGNA